MICTLGQGFLLEPLEDVVEGGEDVDEENECLELGPVIFAETVEFEVLVVYLEGKPGPFHLSGSSLILMEIFERFSLLSGNVVELRLVIKNFLDVGTAMQDVWLLDCSSSSETGLVGQTSLISSEVVDVESLFGLLHSKWQVAYFLFFLSAR